MSYQQLTEERRYQISALLELGISISEIAKKVKCHHATMYRELKRNQTHGQYCPQNAHTYFVKRHVAVRKYQIPARRIEYACFLLSIDWSPEQIYNVLTSVGETVSREWIRCIIEIICNLGWCDTYMSHQPRQVYFLIKCSFLKP
ncbi:transposase [Pseudoalteromonas luteoviolacea]|uniref:transposase n=1 Tax=Pseudoalteromonas luteoviolacea TaxID=43657 RepID=UPI0034E0B1BF